MQIVPILANLLLQCSSVLSPYLSVADLWVSSVIAVQSYSFSLANHSLIGASSKFNFYITDSVSNCFYYSKSTFYITDSVSMVSITQTHTPGLISASLPPSRKPIVFFTLELEGFVHNRTTPTKDEKLQSKGSTVHAYGISVHYA